uniref:Uncharacterized protein n=1 Tax=Heterosigma akashiwo TaxID=2829 RepID=A0A7S3Y5P9_HETAK
MRMSGDENVNVEVGAFPMAFMQGMQSMGMGPQVPPPIPVPAGGGGGAASKSKSRGGRGGKKREAGAGRRSAAAPASPALREARASGASDRTDLDWSPRADRSAGGGALLRGVSDATDPLTDAAAATPPPARRTGGGRRHGRGPSAGGGSAADPLAQASPPYSAESLQRAFSDPAMTERPTRGVQASMESTSSWLHSNNMSEDAAGTFPVEPEEAPAAALPPAPPAPARTWLAGARPVEGGENDDGSARAVAGRRRWASPEPALAYPSPSSEEGSSQRSKGSRGAPVRPVVARVVERRQSLQAAAVKVAAEEGEWRPAAAAPRVPRMKASGGRSAAPAAAQPADDDGPEAAAAHRGRGRDPSVGSVGASSSSAGGEAPAAALRVAVAKGKGEAERAAPAPSKAAAAATVPAVLRRQKRPIFEEKKADPPGGGARGEERHGWGALPLYLSGAVALLLLWQVLAPFLHSPAGAGGGGAAPPRGASGAPPQRFQPAGLILRQGARVPANPLGSAGAAAAAASGSSSRGLLASADGLAARVVADGAAAGGSCALRLQREAEPGNGLHGKPLSQPQVFWEVPHKLSVLGAGKEKLHSLWKKGSERAASAIVDKANNTGSPSTFTDVCIAELSSEGVLALKKGKKTIWKSRKPFKTSVPGMFSLALSSNRLVIMKGEVVLTTVATFTEP